MEKQLIQLTVNGEGHDVVVTPNQTLVDVLREDLELTGTKVGCDEGACGTCTVLIDGKPVRSCLTLAVEAQGKSIETIEGMANGDELHPLQRKFVDHIALQCGICTPGLLIAARSLLEHNPDPSETEVRYWLAGNLCRCTGYQNIITAVLDAAKEMRGA